jgi:hypothetical protein
MPFGISGALDFMIVYVFQAEHDILILMHPFHMLGVAGHGVFENHGVFEFGGTLFSAMQCYASFSSYF